MKLGRRREEQKKNLKAYAFAMLGKFSPAALRAPRLQTLLGESGLGAISEMFDDIAGGASKDKVWARASSRKRALFRKLQLAGIN